MARLAPTCRQCGEQHYNFQSCTEAAEIAAKPVAVPDRFYRPREGERDWGNRLHTTDGRQFGATVVVRIPRKKHPLYTPPSRGDAA